MGTPQIRRNQFLNTNDLIADLITKTAITIIVSDANLLNLIKEKAELYVNPHFLGVNSASNAQLQRYLKNLNPSLTGISGRIKSQITDTEIGFEIRRKLIQYKEIYGHVLYWDIAATYGNGQPQLPQLRIG